ncbi:hypothetical protein AOC06_01610 [Polynucleobacter paludilacus]|jgi:O-antigen/teichoic acid export membrane protein|uniref:lipopolysaccharide biosynthesis protein n=1 Tax=Polynucleobacter paludilacus TaxID=1855895 RepID=UPI001BFE0296|nr:hypothetical protein [Polynucleobacter paludilacus]QWD33994.1 hypothetical protein G6676_01610 [Polynucleobacter paneuropaeus]QWD87304.1 hypothetical protein AOC06_01610 [Polynucleobacter paludilacus]
MSKALLHGASANLLARVSGLAASFLNIFLLGRLLNIADFGLWAWLFAIYSLITSQDFGYISAMRVRIGRHIQTEKSQQQRLLYTAALLMTIFVLVVVIFGIFGYSFIFGNSTEEERLRNLAIFCSSATILGTVSAQALLAHLHTAIVGLVETLRSIIQIIIYALAYFFNWSLTSLVFCFFITCLIYIPLVTKLYLSTTRWQFSEIYFTAKNHWAQLKSIGLTLCKEGWILWVVQIGMTMLIGSDVYLSGFFLEPQDVAKVNIISRFQLLGVGLLAAALTPVIAGFVVQVESVDKRLATKKINAAYLIFLGVGFLYSAVFFSWGQSLSMLWGHIEIDYPIVFVLSGLLLFLTLSTTLMQIFLQFPMVSVRLGPWLISIIVLKIFLSGWLTALYGYIGIFMASIVAVSIFLILSHSLILKQGIYERLHTAP